MSNFLNETTTINKVKKYFPNGRITEGSSKFGTTKGRVLRCAKFWMIESPRYENSIKCWVSNPDSNRGIEIKCDTLADFFVGISIENNKTESEWI